MTNLMSATQARKYMEGYRKTVVENELKKIKKYIEEATSRGEDCTYIHKTISNDTKTILENLGYNVEIHCKPYDEVDTVIKW